MLENQHAPVCQEFLKLGAPRSLRGRLWSQILGSNIKSSVNYIRYILSYKLDIMLIYHTEYALI